MAEVGSRRRLPRAPEDSEGGRRAAPAESGVAAGPDDLEARARAVAERLAAAYPGDAATLCALRARNPYELLVATILSAQCTDERVNAVTPSLFAHYPTADALAEANPDELEAEIRPTGFFRSKARSLLGMARALRDDYGGEVPDELDSLTALPGVGRKTANVILSVAFDRPGLPVDTHVGRLARRLGLSGATDPGRVEEDLTALLPPEEWGAFSLRLILHGRAVCQARRPRCAECILADLCPSAGA
jgi:endonuclease-3